MRLFKILSFNILACLLVVIAFECIFGNWFSQDRINRLNLRRSVHWRYEVEQLYPSAQPVFYTRDPFGLRGSYSKISDAKILTVGGSTTDQPYIDDRSTWQELLSGCLSVPVLNAGVDGQSSYGHVENFKVWFPYVSGLKPKVVLVYVGINDESLVLPDESPDFMNDSILNSSWYETLRSHSIIFHLARSILGQISAYKHGLNHQRVDFSRLKWTDSGQLKDFTFMERKLERYRSNLEELVRQIRSMGAEPVFATQAKRSYRKEGRGKVWGVTKEMIHFSWQGKEYSGNGVDQSRTMARVNKTTMDVCSRLKGFCIDAENEVPWEDTDFYDFQHLTPQGTRKLADLFCRRLLRLK